MIRLIELLAIWAFLGCVSLLVWRKEIYRQKMDELFQLLGYFMIFGPFTWFLLYYFLSWKNNDGDDLRNR